MSDSTLSVGSALLADEQAEQAVLGVLLKRPDLLRDTATNLQPEDFYYERNRIVFASIQALDNERSAVDLVTVVSHLTRHALIEAAGGPAYLSRLINEVPVIANAASYIGILRDYALRRRIVASARDIMRSASESADGADGLADSAVSAFMALALSGSNNTVRPIREPLQELLLQIENQMQAGKSGGLSGVSSGFHQVDKKTNGWQRGDLIILAARPGMGKTAFALNLLTNAAADRRGPTTGVIFSLEMGSTQLAGRILSSMARVPSDRLRSGDLTRTQIDSLYTTIDQLNTLPIFIDETPSISINELSRKCRQLKHEHNLGFIVIDYLQLMTGSAQGKNPNREQEISEISRRLKALARELECPIIALSQLNRAVEQRADKRPMLADLRESGAIEQDADLIIFLYRQVYYDRLLNKTEGDGASRDEPELMASRAGDDAEVIIAKHRSGETGTCMLTFHESFTLFTNRIGEGSPVHTDDDFQEETQMRGFDPSADFSAPPQAPREVAASTPAPPSGAFDDAFDAHDFGSDDDDLPL